MTLAYLAGLFDGEGCVSYQSSGSGKRKRFTLQVNMTDREPLELLAKTLGGNVANKKPHKSHHKPQWRWRLVDGPAKRAYQKLLPYLLIKRQPLNIPVGAQL